MQSLAIFVEFSSSVVFSARILYIRFFSAGSSKYVSMSAVENPTPSR